MVGLGQSEAQFRVHFDRVNIVYTYKRIVVRWQGISIITGERLRAHATVWLDMTQIVVLSVLLLLPKANHIYFQNREIRRVLNAAWHYTTETMQVLVSFLRVPWLLPFAPLVTKISFDVTRTSLQNSLNNWLCFFFTCLRHPRCLLRICFR